MPADPSSDPSQPRRILAVYAHPDDPEVSCAGTLARWADEGAEVHLVICTAGDKGATHGGIAPERLVETRAAEADAAAVVLGLAGHENLGLPDGEVDNTVELRRELVDPHPPGATRHGGLVRSRPRCSSAAGT